ncbi:arginase family protein [Kribbella sp. NPDC023855]|uniref:arginase family protein n=1 Tax=Kribbella sp. NPDC023855 TaxID=3154698 RepID=UPI0033DF1AB6
MTGSELIFMVTIELLDVPSSAGAHSPGQEKAPAALRRTGLVKVFADHGLDVVDQGEQPVTRWQPVREDRGVSNASAVVAIAEQTAQRVAAAVAAGRFPLVIGGDCSITVGALSGLLRAGSDPGLLYFDGGLDLGTPDRTPSGILDSMGLAHMLDEPGSYEPLAGIGPRRPLLALENLVGFGVNVGLDESERLSALRRFTSTDVRRDGVRTAREARELFASSYLIHFDIDVVDFFDLQLADIPVHLDNHTGLPFDLTMDCLDEFLTGPAAGLVLTEVNPDHGTDADLTRLATRLASSLTHLT